MYNTVMYQTVIPKIKIKLIAIYTFLYLIEYIIFVCNIVIF